MKFTDLAKHLERLENTSSRNTMIELLAEMFKSTDADDIGKVVYLMQGRVAPLYEPLEFGMAEKQILKAIAFAYEVPDKEVNAEYKKIGDVGVLAEKLSESRSKNRESRVTVSDVFETLKKVAETGGEGSVEKKMVLVSDLLKSLDPLSARFVVRIPVGKLRLGFSDMTVLDSLSWMIDGTKDHRKTIEPVFNIRPDLGYIATTIKQKGVKGLASATPTPFTPVLMARAERLSSGEEIIAKIGECAIEPKFDGFRLQAHLVRSKNHEARIKLITRNLEDVTFMYPDLVAGIKEQIKADEAIFEGEAIAYNRETGEFLPFQITTQRKRKYDIEEFAEKIPLKLMAFDLLFVDGENMIDKPYEERRKKLVATIKDGDVIIPSDEQVFSDAKKIETFFDDAISRGLEGILAKKLDGKYQAGARGWSWIKFKRSYSSKLDDTVDCVVMGYYFGRGKRTAFGIGGFLIGIYDAKQDQYLTIAKIGTGLTDEEWKTLAERGQKLKSKDKPALYNVDKILDPDVWVKTEIVVEIKADELTRSSVHTAGRVMKASKSGSAFDVDVPGYALRFPRLMRFRDDKKPEDITTLPEIEEMFAAQRHEKPSSSGE
ncbi:MAG TPA: ATP-dependent DNA ligase [Patescibacteria group bacterium]|nr:ATP-dependent DNA ligase [Patescibacteria group bacterium]